MTGFLNQQNARDRLVSGFWQQFKDECNSFNENCFHCETLYQCGDIGKLQVVKAEWEDCETGMKLCSEHYYELKELRFEERNTVEKTC